MKPLNKSFLSDPAAGSETVPGLSAGRCRARAPRGAPSDEEGKRSLFLRSCLCALALVWNLSAPAGTLPSEWRREQHFEVAASGLVKLSLPAETLDAARPLLEDLRLYDEEGSELPYWIERPMPVGKVVQSATSFRVALNPSTTVITLETGMAQPLDAVTLETRASSFIKAVQVEGSSDRERWQTLAQGQPIFRQPNGPDQLALAIPPGTWRALRLTVDDQRSAPVPFIGARVHAAAPESTPSEPQPVTMVERHENPGETRLLLNLGAANLTLAALRVETSEPLFMRDVTLAVPELLQDSIHEQTLGQGVIYRVALEGQPPSSNFSVPLETQVRSRELLLLIRNQDSPPLPISAIRAEARPVYLVFRARTKGAHHLLTGNLRCPAPRYDLAALGADLKTVAVSSLQLSRLSDNPNYGAPEVLPGLQAIGTALDVSAWKFRKAVQLARAGAQQIELDLEVLSRAQPGLADARLLDEGRQLPYVLERTSISRSLTPTVSATNDPKDAKLSRWILKLPYSNLPVSRLSCAARTPLFQREMTLYEELSGERGETYRRNLASASWAQTPERQRKEFVLAFDGPLRSDTLFLETHNGDNPPIQLERFQLFHQATRLLFKANAEEPLFLYYGHPSVMAPRYDLSMVAGQLLLADKSTALLANEERLTKPSWNERWTPGKGGVVFWGVLALVVVVLLAVISRLLPKSSTPSNPDIP